MAGEWLKIELALPDKPEVHYIANALSLDPDAVVGKLLRVFIWFDLHTQNGNALGVTFALVDRLAGVTGFGEAMQFAGWLEQRDKTLCMVNFDRHNGESSKKRALSAKRQSRFRNAKDNAPVTQSALPREEKRREEKQGAPDGGPVWTECLQILEAQNLGEKQARAFLGMLCRDYEEPQIVEAVKAAVGKANVTAYVRGVLKSAPKKGQSGLRLAI